MVTDDNVGQSRAAPRKGRIVVVTRSFPRLSETFIVDHVRALLQAGHEVVVVDNLCNSRREALTRVEELSGRRVEFHRVDLRDEAGLRAVFQIKAVEAVIHFAGLKAVSESVQQPLIARTAGISAHAFDELTRQRPMRPISPTAHTYDGPPERHL